MRYSLENGLITHGTPPVFYFASAILASFILLNFIHAILVSYKIDRLKVQRPTVPAFANVISHVLGLGVPDTEEGRALRRKLLIYLAYMLAAFAAFPFVLMFR